MKKTILLFLLLIPVAYAFTGSNANYNIGGNFGLGAISEHSNGNFTTKAFMQGQPIGQFQNENYSTGAGLYYIEDMGYYIDIETFNMLLNSGWNLISIPLVLENKTLAYALASIDGNYTHTLAYDDGWALLQQDSTIDETMGFWIKMLTQDTLSVSGDISTASIPTKQGWNLIGYPNLNQTHISLTNINQSNIYSYNGSWQTYSPNRNTNPLEILKPGFGYWVLK